MTSRTIVIGAGVAGMTSALLLARHGHQVTLLDAFPMAAPTLRGFHRQGVYFDTGLHYTGSYGSGEILHRYFRYLHLPELQRTGYDPNGFDHIRYPNHNLEFSFPTGYDRIRETLHAAFPQERDGIDTYLTDVRTAFDASPFLNPERDFSQDDLGAMPQDITLSAYLNRTFTAPRLKSILSIHSLLYGVSPDEGPFSNHARIVGSYFQSVHGIQGGGLAIVRAFEQAMESAGVQTRYGQKATRIVLDSAGSLCGVATDQDEILPATQVVCTTHPGVLIDLLPPEAVRPAFRRRLRALEDTPSAYMLFGIADTPVDLLERRNLFICPDMHVPDFFHPERSPEDGPFYVAATEQAGKADKRAIIVITPGYAEALASWADSRPGRRPEAYRQHKAERLHTIRARLLALAPELRSVRFIDGATPLTLRDYMRTPSGSLYGARHSIHQFNPVPATRVPGLLLAGQSIVAPGLLGAVVSAFLTCGFCIGHDVIRKELRRCR